MAFKIDLLETYTHLRLSVLDPYRSFISLEDSCVRWTLEMAHGPSLKL
jgi:hypothetical protein